MSLFFISALKLTIFLNLILGIFVFIKSRNREIKTIFSLICLSIIIWAIPVLFTLISSDSRTILFMRNLSFLSPSFIPFLIFYFSYTFPNKLNFKRLYLILSFIPAIYFAYCAVTGQMVSTVKLSPDGKFMGISEYHPNYYLFSIYFISLMVLSFYKMFKNYQNSTGIAKMQFRYVFLGTFLSAIFSSITNIIMPVLGNFSMVHSGPAFSFFFLVFTAYAIVKHQLLDIKIIIRRGLVYSIVTVIIIFLYLTLIFILSTIFNTQTSLIFTAIAIFAISLSFNPILEWIKKIIDKFFFPERISFQKTFQDLFHKLTSLINLKEILNLFISIIPKELGISSIRIFLWDENKKAFFLRSAAGELKSKVEKTIFKPEESLIKILKKFEKPLELENLKKEPLEPKAEIQEIVKMMETFAINLIVPFFSKKKLICFLFLGPKNNQEIYTKEELAMFQALADEGAVAIENAQLYQEVLDMKNYQDDILKAMTIGIISTNLEGEIITINPRAEEILEVTKEEAQKKRWYEIIKNPSIKNMIPEILTTGKQYINFEIELEQSEGKKISVAINTSFLKNAEKKITGILITLADLTKIKNLEEQIRQAEKLATMGELVAGVAHEINNPLTTITCYKEILESYLKEKGSEVEAKTLDGLTTAVDHLKKVVENFLRFARKTQEVWIYTDIKKVIADALAITRPNLNVSKVEVEEIYEPDLPEIYADHSQLVQVFTNLIVNACHAMPGGGKLSFFAEYDIASKEIEIQVKDTGCGIPPENLPKIFDAFFTTKELTEGTGLGLSVSLGIIQKHKGTIQVKSQPGSGTTFIIRLPVKEN